MPYFFLKVENGGSSILSTIQIQNIGLFLYEIIKINCGCLLGVSFEY